MPTVILLDVSLSMSRLVPVSDSPDGTLSLKDLAVSGLLSFLDHVSTNCKLEFTSLMLFSNLWEKAVTFTRDYELLKTKLIELDSFYDKTNLINALNGVQDIVAEEWGATATLPVNVILVTDGSAGISSFQNQFSLDEDRFKWPSFTFPCRLHVVCLCSPADPCLTSSVPFYRKLIASTSSGRSLPSDDSQIWIPEGSQLTLRAVNNVFAKISSSDYQSWKGKLVCGNLNCPIMLFPPVETHVQQTDFETIKCEASPEISVIGFMDITDVASPAVLSRHLMFPIPMTKEQLLSQPSVFNLEGSTITHPDLEGEELPEEGKQSSLCVLLHGALKVEGMVAICKLAPSWYGMLYSWADSKKKFNLMLSTFNGSEESVPWLASLKNLGNPLAKCFPADKKRTSVKSYSQNVVVWVKQSGLQTDIQKILRLAKRLPEKTGNFYRELSRFRKAAASFGFYEILTGLSELLDRERHLMQPNSEAYLQLQYVSNYLKSSEGLELDIPPFKYVAGARA